MAFANLLIIVECNKLDAGVRLGILEQDLTVGAGQVVVGQVKGLQAVTL